MNIIIGLAMSRVSPHALFSRLVPTRRVLAIEHHPKEGLVALSHTDEYLAHAMSLSTVAEDSFVQVQQKLLTRIRLEVRDDCHTSPICLTLRMPPERHRWSGGGSC